jgi:hypothetical protein
MIAFDIINPDIWNQTVVAFYNMTMYEDNTFSFEECTSCFLNANTFGLDNFIITSMVLIEEVDCLAFGLDNYGVLIYNYRK